MRLSQLLGLYFEEEQWQEAVVEVARGRPLEVEDKHLVRAVTPPPTDEVVREGEEGENEQLQDEELPPQPTPEMIN